MGGGGGGGGGRRNYFMINLCESVGPGRDGTRDPDSYLQSDTLPTALRGLVVSYIFDKRIDDIFCCVCFQTL